jgi:hypothetical protein
MAKNVRLAWLVLTVLGLVAFPYLVWLGPQFGYDSHAYWSMDLAQPYTRMVALEEPNAFLYSPPIAILMAPFHLLPWPVFLVAWTAFLFVLVGWLGYWRWGLALVAFAPVAMELHYGNINLVLAAAIAASFRFPALWAVVLLTKPTAAVGLLFPLLRGDWRAVALPVGIAGFVALGSWLVRPDLWTGYATMLSDAVGIPLIIPLAYRLPVAVAVVIWGALTNRRWTVAVGAAIALPQSWWTNFALLAAIPRLLDKPIRLPAWWPFSDRTAPAPGQGSPAAPSGEELARGS